MPKGKGVRHCGTCGQPGHYASTCRISVPPGEVLVGIDTGKSPPTTTLMLVDAAGNILVNEKRYPNLFKALARGKVLMDEQRNQWNKVLELRKTGQEGAADRLINKILGISKPMSEEAKAKLKEYYEKNKEEIQQRQKEKRELRRRTKEIIQNNSQKLTRKRGG